MWKARAGSRSRFPIHSDRRPFCPSQGASGERYPLNLYQPQEVPRAGFAKHKELAGGPLRGHGSGTRPGDLGARGQGSRYLVLVWKSWRYGGGFLGQLIPTMRGVAGSRSVVVNTLDPLGGLGCAACRENIIETPKGAFARSTVAGAPHHPHGPRPVRPVQVSASGGASPGEAYSSRCLAPAHVIGDPIPPSTPPRHGRAERGHIDGRWGPAPGRLVATYLVAARSALM